MRTILLPFFALAFAAAPASARSFVGEWRATAAVPDAPVSETLTVKKTDSGYSVEAKDVQPPPAEGLTAGPGVDVVLQGDAFSYKRVIATPNGNVEIVYKGTVSGDTFTGTGEVSGFSIPYTGARVK